MSYWIVHREQVTLDLQIEEVKTKEEADEKRNYLQQHYHDSVILDQNDINELYLLARQSSTRKQKDTNK
jgi:hypothetical protein